MKMYSLKNARKIVPLIVLSFLLFQGCKKDLPVQSQDTPGRRDYTWMVDTIHIPRSTIIKMWGSSPTDIWAIADAGEFDSTIYHYDGVKWSCDGIYRAPNPTSLFGLSKNDIWIGGEDGLFWHFDGTSWREFQTLNYLSDKKNFWTGIWGVSSNSIYALGVYVDENGLFNNGLIAHYDGVKWGILNNLKKNSTSTQIYKPISDNKYYLDGFHWNYSGDSSYIFQFDGANLKTLYTGPIGINTTGEIAKIGNDVLFIIGRRIATFDGTNFNDITVINEPRYDNSIIGRSRSDLFLWTLDGIAHYNGTNVQYLFPISSNLRLGQGLVFDSMVLFTATDYNTGNTLIIKGVLKN